MATHSSASDSTEDPRFQAFLNEPLSETSTTLTEEHHDKAPPAAAAVAGSTDATSTPASNNLWWLQGQSSSLNLERGTQNLRTTQIHDPQVWLKPSTVATETTQSIETPAPQRTDNGAAQNTLTTAANPSAKETSPGVITSSTVDSMAAFLERESFFKEESEKERVNKSKDDGAACSDTIDYQDDFTEDISDALLDESQADVKALVQMLVKDYDVNLSGLDLDASKPEHADSSGSSRERSVEEIIEEIEELQNSSDKDEQQQPPQPAVTQSSTVTPALVASSVQQATFVSTLSLPLRPPIFPGPLVEPDLSLQLPQTPPLVPTVTVSDEHAAMRHSSVSTAAVLAALNRGGPSGGPTEGHASSVPVSQRVVSHPSGEDGELSITSTAKSFRTNTPDCHDRETLLVQELETVKVDHAREKMELEQQVSHLSAKVQRLEGRPGRETSEAGSEQRVRLLEGELQQQEQLIEATQRENQKLFLQLKDLKVSPQTISGPPPPT